jgi:hypothetical protein
MTTQDVFGVVVRSIGLVLVIGGVLTFFPEPVVGIGFALVGVAVIGWANWIVDVCYAPKWSLPRISFAPKPSPSPPSAE